MDAAARAELDALRQRAFGRDADIDDDPAAIARLIELEDLAHPRAADEPATATATPAAAPEGDVLEPGLGEDPAPEPTNIEPRDRRPARRRRAQRATLVAGAAAGAAIVVAMVLWQPIVDPLPRAAPSPTVDEPGLAYTADPRSETLLTIRRDGSFGGYIELPAEVFPPPFPATTELNWVTFLGDFYGWELWIAGGLGDTDDEHCIAIRRADETRARCADAEGQRLGTLRVSLAGPDIPPAELPEPMAENERIRFWWRDTGSVDVVMGSFRSS